MWPAASPSSARPALPRVGSWTLGEASIRSGPLHGWTAPSGAHGSRPAASASPPETSGDAARYVLAGAVEAACRRSGCDAAGAEGMQRAPVVEGVATAARRHDQASDHVLARPV